MDKPTVPKIIKDARNKPAFDFDCLTQIKDLDPNAPRFIEFDWELLYACGLRVSEPLNLRIKDDRPQEPPPSHPSVQR